MTAVVDTQLVPGQRLGHYVVLGALGEGAAAVIYKVSSEDGQREFAAKVLRASVGSMPYVRAKFADEVRILSQLDHPNIVRVYDAFQDGEHTACIMDYVEGSSLQDYLPLHPGGLSEVLTTSIALQVVDAMAYAHDMGIVHRDLKPSNILLRQEPDGQLSAIVADFGLAKALGEPVKTHTGLRIGTVAYMAPEQIHDSSRVDARADIYALGVSIYECLTGSLPFPYRSMYEMMQAQLNNPIPSVRRHRIDLSERWDRVIGRASAKEREARYASAHELLRALVEVAEELGLHARTTTATPPVRFRGAAHRVTAMGPGPQLGSAVGGNPSGADARLDSPEDWTRGASPATVRAFRPPVVDGKPARTAAEPVVRRDFPQIFSSDFSLRASEVGVVAPAMDPGGSVPELETDDELASGELPELLPPEGLGLGGDTAWPGDPEPPERVVDRDVDGYSETMAAAPYVASSTGIVPIDLSIFNEAAGNVAGALDEAPGAAIGVSRFSRQDDAELAASDDAGGPLVSLPSHDPAPSPRPAEPRVEAASNPAMAAPEEASDDDARRAYAMALVTSGGPSPGLVAVVAVLVILGLAGLALGLYFAAR